MSLPVLAVLHLSGRNKGALRGKGGGLGIEGQRMLARRDWRKVAGFLEGTWPVPHPPCHVFSGHVGALTWWMDQAIRAPWIALDTEYDRETKALGLIGLGMPEGPALQIPWAELEMPAQQLVQEALRYLVARVTVVLQNFAADLPVLEQALGLHYADFRRVDDLMLAHAVLWSEMPHDLEFLASVYSPHAKAKHLHTTDPLRYNLGDVADTRASWLAVERELEADPATRAVYEEQSLALIPTVLETQARGLRTNQVLIGPAQAEYEAQAAEWLLRAVAYAGWPLNLASPLQLATALYQLEGLTPQHYTDTGQPSVDEGALLALGEVLEEPHPLVEARLGFVRASHVLSHFIRPAAGRARVYPEFKLHAQASGRWSITNPPLQQLPVECLSKDCGLPPPHKAKAPPCWSLEQLYIPDPGEAWVEWDWKQIEPRIISYLSGDEPMIRAFESGEDAYLLDCRDLLGIAEPTSEQRDFAKMFRLRLNYRGKPKGLEEHKDARKLGFTGPMLEAAARAYLAHRPALARYWRTLDRTLKATRCSRTWMGRRRMLLGGPGEILREGGNHPMQGGVADVLNTTVVLLKRAMPWARLVKTKHDSGTFAVSLARVDEALPRFHEIVEREFTIGTRRVRFPADWRVRRAPEDDACRKIASCS